VWLGNSNRIALATVSCIHTQKFITMNQQFCHHGTLHANRLSVINHIGKSDNQRCHHLNSGYLSRGKISLKPSSIMISPADPLPQTRHLVRAISIVEVLLLLPIMPKQTIVPPSLPCLSKFDFKFTTSFSLADSTGLKILHGRSETHIRRSSGSIWFKLRNIERWNRAYCERASKSTTKRIRYSTRRTYSRSMSRKR